MLTEFQCKNFQSQDKSYKKFDDGDMFLLIKPNGDKYWRLKYKYEGKEKLLSLVIYSEVSLKETRKKRDKSKVKISENVDPIQEKKIIKNELKENMANIFENIALGRHRHK